MKVTELRINNWVQFKHTETPVRVILGDFVMAREYKDERLDDYEPIPLTEEWLVKFGFEKKQNKFDNRWDNEYGFEIEVQGDKYAYCVWDESAPHLTTFLGHCKYVHQLQNLYFALTGEELTLNKQR